MIAEGDRIPEVCLKDQSGQEVCLRDLREKWKVLFIYVKDATPG